MRLLKRFFVWLWYGSEKECLICNGKCLHEPREAGRLRYPPDIF
jgi:hypothetical protein